MDNPCGNLATWAVNRVHLLQTISNVAVELPPDAAVELATELLDRLKAFTMHPTEVLSLHTWIPSAHISERSMVTIG